MLSKYRCDEKFELIWSNLMNKNTELDVVDPKLPRKRKLPEFYRCDNFYHDHPKSTCRQLYFENLNNIINSIKDRFN